MNYINLICNVLYIIIAALAALANREAGDKSAASGWATGAMWATFYLIERLDK